MRAKLVADLAAKDPHKGMNEASDSLDQLVSREIRLAGKKRDLLHKLAEGVFEIGGRVCKVDRMKKDLSVTFVKPAEDKEGAYPAPTTMPLK